MDRIISFYKGIDKNVWIRFIGETVNGIAFMMLMPFFALYLNERVGSTLLVGIVMGISPIAAIFGSILGGKIADIYGRKPIMIISMAGNGLVMLAFIIFDSFYSYIIISIFFGLFNSLFHPAASAMVADVTPEDKRTEAFGLLRMGHNIGAAIGPLIGASVVLISKTIIFIASSATLFIYSLIVLLFIKETLPGKTKINEKHNIEKNKDNKDIPSTFTVIFRDKLLFLFIITGIVISMGFSQTEGMLPLHLAIEFPSLTEAQNPYPYLMAFNGTLVVLFQFAISKWASNHPIGRIMLFGAVLFGFGLLGIGWLPFFLKSWDADYWFILLILLIIYGIYTLGEMLMSPVQMTFVANLAPEHLRGTYMGAASLQWIMGSALGPLVGGYLLDKTLGNLLFTLLGIGCIIAGIVYLSLDKLVAEDRKKKNNQEKVNKIVTADV